MYDTTGAFCEDCVRELSLDFFQRHPEALEGMPEDVTTEMLIDEQLAYIRSLGET